MGLLAARWRALVIGVLVVGVLGAPLVRADEWSDPDYFEHDQDNVTRSTQRHEQTMTDPEWHEAMRNASAQSWLEAQGEQLADLENGRLHTGLGQVIPGGAVGDPQAYNAMPSREIQFLTRTGAKLSGRIWGSEAPGPRPGIVITTGSIQATEHMYWWLAQVLARAGYVVMTYDTQGQGESEGFGHEPGSVFPTMDGFPSQQEANFVDGTVDALRFFLSTPGAPYRPVGWSEDDTAVAEANRGGAEQLDWVNPGYAVLDRTRLGIAGHSLGASAVSVVQQCSSAGGSTVYQQVPACHGQSFPILAVVGWDSLRGGSSITPVVPGMDQNGDGYFLNPTPSPSAPNPTGHLSAFNRWTEAGVDTYTFSVRGGTHLEWSDIPFISMATRYGKAQVAYYTLAWFDRYVHPDRAMWRDATRRLLDGPRPDGVDEEGAEEPWRANFFSARYLSAFSFTGEPGRRHHQAVDLRAYAGLSPVGDWAGANADRQGRTIP